MANPPANRRPGVDADIVQATWIRGFDVPAGNSDPTADPCDLIISNGKSQVDDSLSNLIFASRTDDANQPVFVMTQGDNITSPVGSVNFHIGRLEDPNGLVTTSIPGSLYVSYSFPGLWQLQTDTTTWVRISDELGGEDLQQTLAIGNTTGGFNILLTNGDFLKGEDSSVGDGAGANIAGGNAIGLTGNGGKVLIQGGTALGGATGAVEVLTPTGITKGNSGAISAITGNSQLAGNSGGITIGVGDAGDTGFSGTGGSILMYAGRSYSTGTLTTQEGGTITLQSGQATSQNQGGDVRLFAGPSFDGNAPFIPAISVPSRGGAVRIEAGFSAQSEPGGEVRLVSGAGGPAGATGGNIVLKPGIGGGGFAQGEIQGLGNLTATNIKRGTGDPNSAVPGNEGDVYQRTDGGIGQVWVNTNGSITGWQQLAFAGDLVEALQQMQNGYVSPAMQEFGGTDEELYSDTGLFKGLRTVENLGGSVGSSFVDSGPVLRFAVSEAAVNQYAGLDMTTAGTGIPSGLRLENRFFATFALNTRSLDSDTCRFFLGMTSNDLADQLATDLPGGDYVGFMRSNLNANWLVVHRGGGSANFANTGIAKTTTDVDTDVYYFIVDATDSVTPVVRFFILDPDLNIISSITVNTDLPDISTDVLWPAMGVRTVAPAGGGTSFFKLAHAAVTTKAATVAQGGGTGTGALTLGQVLLNGNETDSTLIQISSGSGILGVTDGAGGAGTSFSIVAGATTFPGNNTGTLTLISGQAFGGGAEDPGSTTGAMGIGSGFQLSGVSQGDTGATSILTGSHLGVAGTTGDLILTTGAFSNAAVGTRTQGDILIAPGTFAPNTATVTGEVIIKGGSSNVTTVAGGDVSILSGENSSSEGDTGDINIDTFDVNLDGDSGIVTLATGTGGSNAGNSGFLTLGTGAAIAGNSGAIGFGTGNAGNGFAGSILMLIGDTTSGDGSSIGLFAGDTSDLGGFGGNIELNPGTGALGDGEVIINGKLTVTGLIDPTGLVLDGQASVPTTLSAGEGLLWVDNTASPSRLFFTNDLGTDVDISTGGGATTLGALTDVTLAGLGVGEVLTYNGAQWVNLPGVGGSPLATILGLGNITGGTAGGIVVSDTLGDRIASDGDLVLDPAVAPGSALVLDGLRWPEADGASGYVITTNGAGQLSFQPGGGGSSSETFAEAFTRMQWGAIQPTVGAVASDGIFDPALTAGAVATTTENSDGALFFFSTAAALDTEAGVQGVGAGVRMDSFPVATIKFDGVTPDNTVRFFAGLTNDLTPIGTPSVQLDSALPLRRYVGIQLYTDIPQITLQFVTDDSTGTPTTFNTGIAATGLQGLTLTIDGSVAGEITLTLYDNTFTQLSTTTFVANLPLATAPLYPFCGVHTLDGAVKTSGIYVMQAVTRADLLNAAGGGGNQNLASVLGFGSETGGIPIQGDDNNAGGGGGLALLGGSSTGGGGSGGDIAIAAGTPDTGGSGGAVFIDASDGDSGADGGDIVIASGEGGIISGDGGRFQMFSGDGGGSGNGGEFEIKAGGGGAGGGNGGSILLEAAPAGGGTGVGGGLSFITGAGGAGGGDGGDVTFTLGAGGGAGIDGVFSVIGDVDIAGKLTVSGLIDPTGLLLDSQGSVPFTPIGSDGGIWVNNAGDLIFTNTLGDLNLSTSIGGGMSWLDAMLTAGYGFLSAGNIVGGPQSTGVYGGSVNTAVSPGPPPASATLGQDSDGPFLNFAVGALAGSEAFLGTSELQIQRDSQFKARFKFQSTSPAHTDERIFIGFTDDAAQVTPNPMLATDMPIVGAQYMGLAQSVAGVTLEFVAQGSGGAMVNQFAVPTDALAHYLELDASAASGDVTFSIYAADGVTLEASWTEPASFMLPDLANPMRPLLGLRTDAGTTPRSLDFYYSTVVTRADIVDAVTGGGGGGGAGTLEQVLATGNTTGANGIEFSLLNTGITTEINPAGAGQDLIIAAGDAGAATSSGGQLQLQGGLDTGAPGKPGSVSIRADSTALPGGTGSVTLLGGNIAGAGGGTLTVSSGNPTGPAGGGIALQAGTGTGVNVPGGTLSLNAGQSQGTEAGGDVILMAATGGVGAGTGDGGGVLIAAGVAAGTGAHGGISLLAGAATAPTSGEGVVEIASSPFSGDPVTSAYFIATPGLVTLGGMLFLQGGNAPVASGGDGGDITLQASAGDGAGDDGSIFLLGDGASSFGVAGGGSIQAVAKAAIGTGTGAKLRLNPALGGGVGSAFMSGGDAEAASGLPGGSTTLIGGVGDGGAPGGNATLNGGIGGATGDGGDAVLIGGAAGAASDGGSVSLLPAAGDGTGSGGDITLTGGASGPGIGSVGGNITLAGGASSNTTTGAPVLITGGGSAVAGQGGTLLFQGGNIGSPPLLLPIFVAGEGGRVIMRGGASAGLANGGPVRITGGLGGDTGAGGADGGRVSIAGGAAFAGSGGDGGDVAISAGSPDGAGVPGQITLGAPGVGDTLNLDSPAFKAGTAGPFPAGPLIGAIIPLGTGFVAPPRVVTLTLEGPATGVVITIDLGSVAGGGGATFTASSSIALIGGEILHWIAYL